MDYRRRLFTHKYLYDLLGTDEIFVEVMKRSVDIHRQNCVDYDRILVQQGFCTEQVCSSSDLHLIPPIPTLFYKSHQLSSVGEDRMLLKATTSGTSGKATMVGLDFKSCYYGALMLKRTLKYHRLCSAIPTNYIILGYQPSSHNKMGAVKTAYGATFLAPPLHREFALKDNGISYDLNIDGVRDALVRYSRSKFPTRIIGFPAYLFYMMKQMQENNLKLKLAPGSKIILGGGWKQFFSEKVEIELLYRMAEETLGIMEENITEFFAVVESMVAYIACKHHHFHVPIYGRVIIRDPRSLEPVPNGTPGLLNLLSPLVSSMPLGSIITDDIAILHDGKNCGCGIDAPYFEILGRAGMSEIKTCAAGAGEMLEGVRQ